MSDKTYMDFVNTPEVELLAPAGSWESMTAAIAAGADAVYMGGTRFGARAYAQNPEDDRLLEAINYVHLHGKKLYLTVNTLLKEEELEQELYSWLAPLYEQGLDAVIVQDVGVVRFIQNRFPNLPIHASTQMTITGPESCNLLKKYGVTRIVMPRELNLKEISVIKKECGLEIESFVHGALCYCYSGQCLFSSIVGGRSGNRGRCAQPCRMEYLLYEGKKDAMTYGMSQNEMQKIVSAKSINRVENAYLLSLKDLNTLAMLPDIIDAGVTSLKIEGRMKKAEYTAGVVSIYRKYLDMYKKNGRKGYKIDQEDQKKLWNLFNRKGFTEGYYKKQNGKDMITFTKPDFRVGQESYLQELNRKYVQTEAKEEIVGEIIVKRNEPICFTVYKQGVDWEVGMAYGDIPESAQKQPLTKETLRKQLSKMGGTSFMMNHLTVHIDDGLYVPVVALNTLRRNALVSLEKALYDKYKRKLSTNLKSDASVKLYQYKNTDARANFNNCALYVQVETKEQLEVCLKSKPINGIYIDTLLANPKEYASIVAMVKKNGKKCFLAMPFIFRQSAKQYLEKNILFIQDAKFDGFLIRSLEELFFLEKYQLDEYVVADHNIYAWNKEAVAFLRDAGCTVTTLPVELTGKEWRQRSIAGEEVIAYGRIPMMVSAQCLKKSTLGCNGKPEVFILKDRMGNRMPVKNDCTYCYNVIYNNRPLSLHDEVEELLKNKLGAIRLSFTTETKEEVQSVIKVFSKNFVNKNDFHIVKILDKGSLEYDAGDIGEFTRGHYKRETE